MGHIEPHWDTQGAQKGAAEAKGPKQKGQEVERERWATILTACRAFLLRLGRPFSIVGLLASRSVFVYMLWLPFGFRLGPTNRRQTSTFAPLLHTGHKTGPKGPDNKARFLCWSATTKQCTMGPNLRKFEHFGAARISALATRFMQQDERLANVRTAPEGPLGPIGTSRYLRACMGAHSQAGKLSSWPPSSRTGWQA